MSNLALVPTWHDNINMVDVTEPIVGGGAHNNIQPSTVVGAWVRLT